jgi:uncharacterized protein YlxW (UPF0749 family)
MIHNIIIVLIIAVIVCCQIKFFLDTNKKIKQFDDVFPCESDNEWVIQKEEGYVQIVSKQWKEIDEINKQLKDLDKKIEKVQAKVQKYKDKSSRSEDGDSKYEMLLLESEIEENGLLSKRKEKNECLCNLKKDLENCKLSSKESPCSNIINSINQYLEKNKDSVTEFNLIRDIIDRNCDVVEEEIQTLIPIPLYCGLIGTMLGILVGVAMLVFNGSLEGLLNGVKGSDLNAAEGINALFGGVALAMGSSFLGIFLTTLCSYKNKDIKISFEGKKHKFITWLQAELLPKISSDFTSALVKLGNDLSSFNGSFSSNANLLQKTILNITDATLSQKNLLETIEKLDVAKMAKANIEVYESLKNCREEIVSIATNLTEVQSGIRGVGDYMYEGINEYEKRYTYIQDASGKVDIAIRTGHEKLSKEVSMIFNTYGELINTLYLSMTDTTKQLAKKYEEQAESLHKAIVDKLSDVRQLENELKNLVAVKTSMANLEKATTEQNRKIENLTSVIHELAQVKVTGKTTSVAMNLPKLYKVLIISTSAVVVVTALFFIITKFLEIIGVI